MIGIGDAAFGRLTEQEPRGHLWIVVSKPTADGFVAVANLTSHRDGGRWHDESCVVVRPQEHPFVVHNSCVALAYAHRLGVDELNRKFDELLERHESCSMELLVRIQEGLLASTLVAPRVKSAIQGTV